MSKKEYHVRDLVIDDEYGLIDSNASIQDAAKKMKELGVPDLVVVEEKTKKVLGVIADFDIVQNVVAEGIDPKAAKVLSTMYNITPVTLETPVSEAFTIMQNLDVNVVPVIEKEKLIGVCTIQDCWSYIPDENEDEIGLIPVSNPKNAEFWFTSVCSILAFVLGILLPLVGIFGFFAIPTTFTDLFGIAGISGEQVNFYLFDARGLNFFIPFLNLIPKNGTIWLLMVINGFLILITSIMGLFSLIYSSYSDVKNIQTGQIVRKIIPALVIIFMILEWILFPIAFGTTIELSNITIDGIGLFLSIITMILIIVAINRDYIFRQKGFSKTKMNGGSI